MFLLTLSNLVTVSRLLTSFFSGQLPADDTDPLGPIPSPPTDVPADTLAAYLNTDYRFGQGAEVVTLRIDTRSEALQWLTTWTGHCCGVFITAHNPLGVR